MIGTPFVNIYCDGDDYFSDIILHGTLPMIAECSLLHVLGKAPVPGVVFLWEHYLQFLIDIGYINDFTNLLYEW